MPSTSIKMGRLVPLVLEASCPRKPNVLLHSIADRVDLLGDSRRALELQMQISRLLCGEGLPAMRALERAIELDPDILERSVARLGTGADLHRFRHLPSSPRCQVLQRWLYKRQLEATRTGMV